MQLPLVPTPLSASMGVEGTGLELAVSKAMENRVAKKSIGSVDSERRCGVWCGGIKHGRSSLSADSASAPSRFIPASARGIDTRVKELEH